MATYNGETFLPEMLESLARQTRLPDELVVRDDASSDDTVRVVEEFAGRAPFPVRMLERGERLGYAQNFVTTSNACSGDLIFFADQDDSWRPHKLETVSLAAHPERSEAFFHDFALQSDDGTEIEPSFYGLLAGRGFGRAAAVNGCTMAVTRGFVDLWGWPSATNSVAHDVWVALLSTGFGQRRYLDEVLIDYRIHEGNVSGWMPSAEARVFTDASRDSSDVDTLIDLFVKKRKMRRWTQAFLDVVAERADVVDPDAARSFARSLRTNRRRHREARREPQP
jgi:glycosyltransferase involved in cell wall biosynthesis